MRQADTAIFFRDICAVCIADATGIIWNDTNFYISAQQLIAVILAVIGAFAGAGMAIAWALYGLLRRKPQ